MRMYVCLFVRARLFMNMFVCLSLPPLSPSHKQYSLIRRYTPANISDPMYSPGKMIPPVKSDEISSVCHTCLHDTYHLSLSDTSDHTHQPNAHLSVRCWRLSGMMGLGLSRQ